MSEQNRRAWGERQPINRHPLFPAIVALWCGALLGVASILVSPSLIESVVVSLGIDKVIPMAAPPLGATTRILLALLMTGVGAAVGLLLARRFAAAPAELPERRRRTVPVEQERRKSRIVLARKDRSTLSPRRRSLATQAEHLDDGAERAPVPGQDKPILSVAEFDLDGFDCDDDWLPGQAADTALAPEDRAPASASFAPRPPAGAQVFQSEPEPAGSETGEDDDDAPASLFESYSREIAARAGQAPARDATIVQPPVPGFMLLSSVAAPAGSPPPSEDDDLVEETLAALSDEGGEEAFGLQLPAWAGNEVAEPEIHPADTALDPAENLGSCAAERIASADLDDLSPVELLERLALVMARRREQARQAAMVPAEPEPATEAEGEPVDALPSTHTQTPAPPAFQTPAFAPLAFEPLPFRPVEAQHSESEPAPIPLALRPVSLQAIGEEDEDEALAAYIPPRHIGLAPAHNEESGADDDSGDEENRVLEEGYSSLLNLSRPLPRLAATDETSDEPADPCARPEAGRDAPIPMGDRRFDGPARSDPEATERALREALATLQRMSGAA